MKKVFLRDAEYASPDCMVLDVRTCGVVCQSPSQASIDDVQAVDFGEI